MANDFRLRQGSSALDKESDLQYVSPIDFYGTLRRDIPLNSGVYEGPPVSVSPVTVSVDEDNPYISDIAYDASKTDESSPALTSDEQLSLFNVRLTSRVRAGLLRTSSTTHEDIASNFTAIARMPVNRTGYITGISVCAAGPGNIKIKELLPSTANTFTVIREIGSFVVASGRNNVTVDPVSVSRDSYIGIYSSTPINVYSDGAGKFWRVGNEKTSADGKLNTLWLRGTTCACSLATVQCWR